MATAYRVGGEVDAFCNKCKLSLAHTILAMVGDKPKKVQCNTCHGQHVYRGTEPTPAAKKAPRAAKSASEKPSRSAVSVEELLAGKDLSTAKKYSPQVTFTADDIVDHPTFGYGIVRAVRPDKVDVIFKSSEKTLVHARAGGAATHATFTHPKNLNEVRAENAAAAATEEGQAEAPAQE